MPIAKNTGRFQNFVSGINGVSAGGVAVINMPVNMRYHSITLNVTNAGSAVAVATVITGIKLVVNGVAIRDIAPADIIRIQQACGYYPNLGELTMFFTEPWQKIIEPPDQTSWDMAGQSSFQILINIAGGTTPGITGTYDFDFQRNLIKTAAGPTPYLQIVAQHSFTQQVIIGKNDIITLPFSYPIRRIWIKSTTNGGVTELDVYQDGNKVMEALTPTEISFAYASFGFRFSQLDAIPWVNATGPATLGVSASKAAVTYYDAAYISDPDLRLWNALKIANQLIVRTTNSAAEAQTITVEYLPGGYFS